MAFIDAEDLREADEILQEIVLAVGRLQAIKQDGSRLVSRRIQSDIDRTLSPLTTEGKKTAERVYQETFAALADSRSRAINPAGALDQYGMYGRQQAGPLNSLFGRLL